MQAPTPLKRTTMAVAVVGAVALTSLVVARTAGGTTSGGTSAPLPTASAGVSFPKNSSGQTYGSELDAVTPDTAPDLILAIATNGLQGYVKRNELRPTGPTSPGQALSEQSSAAAVREIPVYAVDGKTKIGVFDIDPGSGYATAG